MQHTTELLIEYILIERGGKCRGKAYILQQKLLHNKQRVTLTQLHSGKMEASICAHPWKKQASSSLLSFFIEYIIDCKRLKEQRQSLPTAKMFAQHTQGPSHTAVPSTRKRLSRCTSLETAVVQHTPELIIEHLIN